MSNHSGSKKTLSTEVTALRKQVSDLKEAAHERRRVEDALRTAESLYHRTLEDAPVAILRLSPAGKVLFANAACIRLLGYESRQDFQTIGDLRGVFADDVEVQRVIQLASSGVATEIVVRCRLQNGDVEAVRLFAGARSREEGVTLIHSGGLGENDRG